MHASGRCWRAKGPWWWFGRDGALNATPLPPFAQYDWEGPVPLWRALRSEFIDWRYSGPDVGNDTLTMDYVAEHNNETEYRELLLNKARGGRQGRHGLGQGRA